jgi:MinD superfamily P-loop ATPase
MWWLCGKCCHCMRLHAVAVRQVLPLHAVACSGCAAASLQPTPSEML